MRPKQVVGVGVVAALLVLAYVLVRVGPSGFARSLSQGLSEGWHWT